MSKKNDFSLPPSTEVTVVATNYSDFSSPKRIVKDMLYGEYLKLNKKKSWNYSCFQKGFTK